MRSTIGLKEDVHGLCLSGKQYILVAGYALYFYLTLAD